MRRDVLPVADRIEANDYALMESLVRKAGTLGLLAGTRSRTVRRLGSGEIHANTDGGNVCPESRVCDFGGSA